MKKAAATGNSRSLIQLIKDIGPKRHDVSEWPKQERRSQLLVEHDEQVSYPGASTELEITTPLVELDVDVSLPEIFGVKQEHPYLLHRKHLVQLVFHRAISKMAMRRWGDSANPTDSDNLNQERCSQGTVFINHQSDF